MLSNQSSCKLAVFKTDRGGEFTSNEFSKYLSDHGIIHEMGPPESPQQNSVVERFNRTLAHRLRAQLIHGNLPLRLWGEVIIATSHILNLCPSKAIEHPCPEFAWQHQALGIRHPKINYKRLRVIGCIAYSIPPGHQTKLMPRSVKSIMVGYEPNSNAYRLWDPASNRVLVSNDTVFDESRFPLRENNESNSEELTTLNDPVWEEVWECPQPPSTSTPPPPAPPVPADEPIPVRRSTRNVQPVDRLGDLVGYHSVAAVNSTPVSDNDDGTENDEPSYSKAMKGVNRADWLKAMSDEFTSLQTHAFGRLVEPPPNANILPGMWRLKRKRDEFGKIIKYKARWVAGGNHQIKGVDFESTYASVGLTDTLRTLYAMAAKQDLEMAQFDIETAFLNGKMKHTVYVRQVTGFLDTNKPHQLMELDRSLYGTCQAHREFNDDLDTKLKLLGFTVCPVDNSLYTLRNGSRFIHVPMHQPTQLEP